LKETHCLYCSLLGLIAVGMGQMQLHDDLIRTFPNKFGKGQVTTETLAYGDIGFGYRFSEKQSHMDTTVGPRDCISISRSCKTLYYQAGQSAKEGSRDLSCFGLGTNNIHRAGDRVRSGTTQTDENLAMIYHLAVAMVDCLTLVITYPKGTTFSAVEEVRLVTEVYQPAIQRLADYINGTNFEFDVLETLTWR